MISRHDTLPQVTVFAADVPIDVHALPDTGDIYRPANRLLPQAEAAEKVHLLRTYVIG